MLGARADCAAASSCVVSWELARNPVTVYGGPSPERIDRSAPAAVVRRGDHAVVPNPEPGAPRYFEVVPKGRRRGPVVGDRFLHLAGSANARDLGGYLTADGQRTRWGRLFRADGLDALTDDDRARLGSLDLAPACPDPVVGPVTDATLTAAAAAVTSRAARARDRALLRRLARAPTPQWVQCDLFADRLGWSAAVVLTTLGVGRETVVADHLLSAQAGVPPTPDRTHLDTAFEAIRRRYRTWGRYLGRGLGIDQRTYDRLRQRYVTDRGGRR